MSGFCHLHGHSDYSFLDGYGTPAQIARRVLELGQSACAVTDHGNVFAHAPYQKAFHSAGLKPVFGCEFYVDFAMDKARAKEAREEWHQQEESATGAAKKGAGSFCHVTVLARTQRGYGNLLKLSRLSWEEGFHYKPRIDWETLYAHQEGLVVLSGCVGGWPSMLLTEFRKRDADTEVTTRGLDACRNFLVEASNRIEYFYLELIPSPEVQRSRLTVPVLMTLSQELAIPAVLTGDPHFPRPDDFDAQDTLLAVGTYSQKNDPHRPIQLSPHYYYCEERDLLKRAADTIRGSEWQRPEAVRLLKDAAARTGTIAQMCEAEVPRAGRVVFPGVDLETTTSEAHLWAEVKKGAVRRCNTGDIPAGEERAYYDRARREFSILCEKGFADYILTIADLVRWAKEQGHVAILRGSAGGCLLLWLLGASVTDPIRLNLPFERFYDPFRPDPPDVDIDFEQGRRAEAMEYLFNRYGQENCAQIAALSLLKAKAAVNDCARALGIRPEAVRPLALALHTGEGDTDKRLSEITDPAALKVLARYPELARIVPKLVGHCRQHTVHAAGVLVSNIPLTEALGIILVKEEGKKEKLPLVTIDKRDAKYLGYLKIDCLAVIGLDVLGVALRDILGIANPMEWLERIPLDDARTLAVAQRGFLAGIHQLDGASAARVSREIGLDTFEDLVAASGLCRPGPGEWVPYYSTFKRNPAALEKYLRQFHPAAAPILRPTFGILLYQEQVMAIAREVAGLPEEDVQRLRKEVSDKYGADPETGDQWREEWEAKFLGACERQGVCAAEAHHWWHSIVSHGGYSFNRAHCVSYGVVGWWMLYLKAHYPAAYYEAYLRVIHKVEKEKRLLHEFRQLGGKVNLIDPRRSVEHFSRTGRMELVGGWIDLKGVGDKAVENLQKHAPFRDWAHFLGALPKGVQTLLRRAQEGDTSAAIALAPWYPVAQTMPRDAEQRTTLGLSRLDVLRLGEPQSGDASVAGYVTATDFTTEKMSLTLEDETGAVEVRCSARRLKDAGDKAQVEKMRALKPGDYAAILGWWAGDALYIKRVACLRNGGLK